MQAYRDVILFLVLHLVVLYTKADAFIIAIALVILARDVIIEFFNGLERHSLVERSEKGGKSGVLDFPESNHVFSY